MKCPQCQIPSANDVAYCTYCGAAMPIGITTFGSRLRPMLKSPWTAVVVLGILAFFIVGSPADRKFIADWHTLCNQAHTDNVWFYKEVYGLEKQGITSPDTLAHAYATLLRVRMRNTEQILRDMEALKATAKTRPVQKATVEMLHEVLALNQKVYNAAEAGDLDRVLRIEEDNEAQIRPMLESFKTKLELAGIKLPDDFTDDISAGIDKIRQEAMK